MGTATQTISPSKTATAAPRHTLWLRLALFLPAIAAVGLFVLPFPRPGFFTFGYMLFLAAMLVVPSLLAFRQGRFVRSVFILFALGYFGFLQTACPRPIGAIELIAIHLFDENPVLMHVVKVSVLMTLALLFARYYCGWICPNGVIMEYVYQPRLGVRVPPRLDRVLKLGKYITLALLVVLALVWHYRFFRAVGPFKVIFNLEGPTPLIVFLGVTLVSGVFIERSFCRYLCPLGGLLGLASLLSPLKMRVRDADCSSCGLCEKACPVDAITVEKDTGCKISHTECILCTECRETCNRGGIEFGLPARPAPPEERPAPARPGHAVT
jgi:polyferredoxin